MPAIFFLSHPPTGESGAGVEGRAPAERDDPLGYSGHLSFDGGFDQYGFTPRRDYAGGGATHAPERRPEPGKQPG